MPALLAEIKKDLTGDPDVRDVAVLPNERVSFNWPHAHFRYYQSDDPEMRPKFERLQEAGYVQPKPSNVPVYRMTPTRLSNPLVSEAAWTRRHNEMPVTVQFCTSLRRTNPYTHVMVGLNLHCPVCRGIDIFRDAYPEPTTGATVTLFYYCGGCTHSWQVVAPDARQPAPVALRPMKDRRKSA